VASPAVRCATAAALGCGQCNTIDAFHFTFTDGANGNNVLVDQNGECLDTGTRKPGPEIQEMPCTYGISQQFTYNTDTGALLAGGATSKKCVTAAQAAQDAAVFVARCGSTIDPQTFSLGH
jgi:Ricin-type beta-trefoil lectin domain